MELVRVGLDQAAQAREARVVLVLAALVAQGLAQEQGLESVKLAVPAVLMAATVAVEITPAAGQAAVLLVLAAELVQAQARGPELAQGLVLELVGAAPKAAVTVKAAAEGQQTELVKAAAVDPAVAATKVAAREAVAKPV